MTPPPAGFDTAWWPYVALIGCAFLPSEIWRWLAVLFARRLDENAPAITFVRLMSMGLMAALVVKLTVSPSGALAAVPLAVRLGALGVGLLILATGRHRVFLALVSALATLAGGAWLFS